MEEMPVSPLKGTVMKHSMIIMLYLLGCVLMDDLEHCVITGDSNVAIHHVFNGLKDYDKNAARI